MVADIVKRLKPVLGEYQADTVWNLYLASDDEGRKQIHQYLEILYSELIEGYDKKIVLEPPEIGSIAGSFVLGLIIYPDKPYFPLSITKTELNNHVLICGRTGVGKTTLIYRLLSQIYKDNLPFLIFDFKRDYRHFAKYFSNLTVIPWHELRFNPLTPPPGMDHHQWLQIFSDLLCQTVGVLLGSKGYLLEQLTILLKTDKAPTLAKLADILENTYISPTRRQAVYLDVIRNRLKTVLITLGDVINSQGFDLPKMLESNVVLELDGLTTEMQDFLVNIILTQIFSYRIAANQRGKLRHAIIFDEAKRVFDANKEKKPVEGIPAISILASRIREFGEALIVSDQEPTKLAESIKANCEVKIAFGLGNGKDAIDMGKSMGLDEKQTSYLNRLPVGHAIVQIPRYGRPMLIRTTEIPKIEKTITDAEVRQMKKPGFIGEALKITDSSGKEDFGGDSAQKGPEQPLHKKPEEIRPILQTGKKGRKGIYRLLSDIEANPLTPVRQRYKRLKLSAYRGNKYQKILTARGMIKPVSITTKNGLVRLFEITERARKRLNCPETGCRKGGIEHQYWVRQVKIDLEKKGYSVKEEYPIGNGETIDMAIIGKRKKIAIEIETGKSDAIRNIEKCLKAGFEVVSVATNKAALGHIQSGFAREYDTGTKNVRIAGIWNAGI